MTVPARPKSWVRVGDEIDKWDFPAIAPDTTVLAVGDIHGCFKALKKALTEASRNRIVRPADHARIVFLGDYIDRGENSDAVLAGLYAAQREFPEQVICLQGNHEQMMLGFLDEPERWGQLWLRNGGLQTLASYGVGRVSETTHGSALIKARNQLREILPRGLESWLRHLPRHWRSGNLVMSHAGADPDRLISEQLDDALVWGHANFLSKCRNDGIWVVHGHNAVSRASAVSGRVAIDTGAYFSGILTMAVIRPWGTIEFHSN